MGSWLRTFTRVLPRRTAARQPRLRGAPTADPLVLLAFALGLAAGVAAGVAVALQSEFVTQIGASLGDAR